MSFSICPLPLLVWSQLNLEVEEDRAATSDVRREWQGVWGLRAPSFH